MGKIRTLLLVWSIAMPALARADVTVIYAPASPPAPLVARTIAPQPVEPVPVAMRTPRPCPTPVVLVRVADGAREQRALPLLDCEGQPDRESLVALSVLARPRALTTPPSAHELGTHSGNRDHVAAGIARLHPGLLERVRVIADRFRGHEIEIVSGYRPDARSDSRHRHGLALDLRVTGVSLDEVYRFVSRFDRTGVGLYRSGNLIHIDVRERSMNWTGDEDAEGGSRVAAEAATEDAPLDADAIADEIMRDLRSIPLPVPSAR